MFSNVRGEMFMTYFCECRYCRRVNWGFVVLIVLSFSASALTAVTLKHIQDLRALHEGVHAHD